MPLLNWMVAGIGACLRLVLRNRRHLIKNDAAQHLDVGD